MNKLSDLITFNSGSPQFRIKETFNDEGKLYSYYTQTNLLADLSGIYTNDNERKQVRTNDKVDLLKTGDVIFSLISGTCALVSEEHDGYLYSQNFVKVTIIRDIDAKFLVYLLNENKEIRQQLTNSLQGSLVLKYTLRQLKELTILKLPSLDKQIIIGNIYFMQNRLTALRNRTIDLEKKILVEKIEGVIK